MHHSQPRFQDKVVVVTGAASGIGRAVASAFVAEGARVHLADIDGQGAQSAAAALGPTAKAHGLDCADFAAVSALAEAVDAEDGGTDILVNNAGVVGGGPVEAWSLDAWRRVVDVDLWGVIHGMHAFVPRMKARGGGQIVNVASMAGLVAMPMVAPYCAAKFAVVGLSESLGPELAAHGVHVTCVCPGMVRTDVYRTAGLELPGSWGQRIERWIAWAGEDPDTVANDILNALIRRRKLVITAGGWMVPLWWARRLFPEVWLGAVEAFMGLATDGSRK